MPNTGDIVIIPSTPPHVASVINSTQAMCEDGVIRPYPPQAFVACKALELLQTLTSEVLRQNDAR